MLKIPEQAIQCFEELTGTCVACYVHSAIFTQALKQRIHNTLPCNEMKKYSERHCIQYDCLGLCRDAWKFPEGGVKLCYAGILEWVMPVMREGKLLCLLTAGIRRPPQEEIPTELIQIQPDAPIHPPDLSTVPRTDRKELFRTMEALRQLAARLLQWHEKMYRGDFAEADLSRGDLIRIIINREASKQITLEALAKKIHLSPSRTAHLVKEETGQSFMELLMENRLDYASNLLKNTIRPVSEIALNCGFGSVANFHRMFRKYYGITPLAYRKLPIQPLFRPRTRESDSPF